MTKSDGGYLWGFDQLAGVDHRQVDQVEVQADGNFVATDANGRVLWRALAATPDPSGRLELSSRGALQLVSPTRGVLWSSDGTPIPDAVAGNGFPFTAGQALTEEREFTSPSGNHVLKLQNIGNLYIALPNGRNIWSFNNNVPGLDYRQVKSVRMLADGNLVALGADGSAVWKALVANPDPASRLELTYTGVLQLVSPSRGILWSSNGILTPPIRVAATPAGASPCEAEAGWTKWIRMAAPQVTIVGTPRVTDSAMNAVADVYAELFSRLKPAFPQSTFDGFRVYVTDESQSVGSPPCPSSARCGPTAMRR